ncbi:MAG: hypothetical protein ACRC67_43670 [Inquilinus sp.]|uniref:hypothetical protein n=1 Tax=Inquilinus sp. TaxID=1932117 RepID=UPI003F2A3881
MGTDREAEAHSDHGTVVKQRQAAIVFDEDDGFRFLMPEYGDGEQLPEGVLLLAAVLLKLDDEEWVAAMLEEFRSCP